MIVSTRKRLEAELFAQTGVSAIKWELSKLGSDFPSDSTINCILHKEGLVKKPRMCLKGSSIRMSEMLWVLTTSTSLI